MAYKRGKAAAFDVGRYDNKAIARTESRQAGGATGAGERALGTQIRLGNKTVTLPAQAAATMTNYYVDGSDSLANRGLTIDLVHVPTGNGVRFKAFLMAFNESYNSDWSSESVYGRADPIHMFKQTSRSISLSWKIVAATESEAVENLVRLQSFLQMLYPTYMEPNEAQTINQSPLIRLQMSNMVRKSAASKNLGDLRSADVSADTNTGLLGIIKNVSVTHNMENPDIGVFELGTRASVDDAGENSPGVPTNNIVPKSIEVQMDFSVVHEHMLGWTKSATGAWTFGGGSAAGEETAFPYYVKDGTATDLRDTRATVSTNWKDLVDEVNADRTSYATTVNELAQYSETIGAAFQAAGVDATTVEGTALVAQYRDNPWSHHATSDGALDTEFDYTSEMQGILELTR